MSLDDLERFHSRSVRFLSKSSAGSWV